MNLIFLILIIFLLNILKTKRNEGFIEKCIGKRDGISGCRDCCSSLYPNKYNSCVSNCMKS